MYVCHKDHPNNCWNIFYVLTNGTEQFVCSVPTAKEAMDYVERANSQYTSGAASLFASVAREVK
jgi:hypothetical protein